MTKAELIEENWRELVSELGAQLDLDGCHCLPKPLAEFAIELVYLPNVAKTRALDETAIIFQGEPVATKPVVVQIPQLGDGEIALILDTNSIF